METRSKRQKQNSDEVKERRTKRRKVKSENVTDGNFCDFNSLPDEILLVIFRYLTIKERWIVGRVCKKWYEISRDPDPLFWKKVFIVIEEEYRDVSERVMKVLQMLPQSVSSLRIDVVRFHKVNLSFSEFSATMLRVCPNLEELFLEKIVLTDTESSRVINLSNSFPVSLKVLKLYNCQDLDEITELKFEDSYISNIEIFDMTGSYFSVHPNFLLQMPRLRELYGLIWISESVDSIGSVINQLEILDLTRTYRDIFHAVLNYGVNLTELYVCYTGLQDDDIGLLQSTTVFPRLKVLCLRGCPVTYKKINMLIKSRLSLRFVYVGISNKPVCDYRKFDYNRCNSVKVKNCDYQKNSEACKHEEGVAYYDVVI